VGKGKTRRLGGGQARSGCFCRRVAALGQLHDSFAQCITEATSSLAQDLQNTRARLNINHDILREPAFGYSRRLKWHGAMLAIGQSRACNSAIHATSPDPISGHRSVFKLLSSCANMQRVEVVLQQMLLHISIEIYLHPKIPGLSDELYIRTHATQKNMQHSYTRRRKNYLREEKVLQDRRAGKLRVEQNAAINSQFDKH
jgi:hypothetical protein